MSSEDVNLFFVQDEDGLTDLHEAVIDHNLELTLTILSTSHTEAQVNLAAGGSTALHFACRYPEYPDIVRALILAGANPDIRDAKEDTALHIAVSKGGMETVKAMTDPWLSLVDLPLCSGRIPQDIAVTHTYNQYGQYPIHLAAMNADTDMVNLLVRVGGDINERNRLSGFTALHIAILGEDEKLMRNLAKHEITLLAQTHGGFTPYTFALMEKHDKPELLTILKEYGAHRYV